MVLLGSNPVLPVPEFQTRDHQGDGDCARQQTEHEAPLTPQSKRNHKAQAGQARQQGPSQALAGRLDPG
jgi:hypothetical protein